MSPSHAIFFEASHWPSDHMTRSRPLIGGQKWTQKVAVKSGPQKWRPKVAAKSGDQFKFFQICLKDKSCNLFKFVSVLLSASVERFFVSRMRDLKKNINGSIFQLNHNLGYKICLISTKMFLGGESGLILESLYMRAWVLIHICPTLSTEPCRQCA